MAYLSALVIWTASLTSVVANNVSASGELCDFRSPILAPFTHLAEEAKFVTGRKMREVNLTKPLTSYQLMIPVVNEENHCRVELKIPAGESLTLHPGDSCSGATLDETGTNICGLLSDLVEVKFISLPAGSEEVKV